MRVTLVVAKESELECSTSMSERSKRRVVLHKFRYLLEIIERFRLDDCRDIISRLLCWPPPVTKHKGPNETEQRGQTK